MPTLGLALMGTGRMAHVYGPKINAHPGLRLEVVYNPRIASAQKAADLYCGRAMDDLNVVLSDPKVDAVVIATPTDTHVDYIEMAARAGKPIYCEKPLDQSLDRVERAMAALDAHPVPFMLGFNRRFDPDNAALREAVRRGEIGRINMLMSWSREPSPPPIEYVRTSGGYFVDATIHDIDLLCWIAGERPVEVTATGSCMFDSEIGAEGDFDMTMTTLKMPSGALVHINNSRSCAYGFDQRLEAFGNAGMVQTLNHRDDNLVRWDARRTAAREPLKHFFLERYDQSFYNALDEFHGAIIAGRPPSATAQDGKAALTIALACVQSAKAGVTIKPTYS
ncbi:Gfo/Idh/MocA family oxidoreductase [Marivita sp. XM-24bin2]|jgi:myo-inositol 2-dehydrogenase/D-chiro-inositol 1-dehydrogenase|uniref:Gfo/Idh/MocA family protein n=1 Tax=unclassified Marivita TaxID=2632480 RepID=UPI0025C34C16|nr:Gfo/Idh/MocA family oxidoreductase [Marivita sp. XM-24bin2]MCR9110964.1 Gfo/Idh/MocA family oxidoreductase [Paracoccaceae bacterium]